MRMHIPLTTVAALALVSTISRADDAPQTDDSDPAAMFARLDTNKDGVLAEDEVAEEHKGLFGRLFGG